MVKQSVYQTLSKDLICSILVLLFLVNISHAQNKVLPLDLAKAIFSKRGLPDIGKHITGEYSKRGKIDIPEHLQFDFLLLGQEVERAVVSITITDTTQVSYDVYMHFVKEDGIWKATALRALAMTGIIKKYNEELEQMTYAEVENMIEISKKDSSKASMFESISDYEFDLGNTRLTLATDQEIVKHFEDNINEFNSLKKAILTKSQFPLDTDTERSVHIGEQYVDEYMKLYISSISVGGYEFGSCLNFTIGGMLDNAVGYIYVDDKKNLPSMHPSRIIMLREIKDGWYMYKTT